MPLPAALLVTALATAAQPPNLHRVGNKLLDRDTGKPVVLKGMAMMGGEYSCVHGQGVFAGPANETVVDGMVAWGINAIRLPMNEDCWLGQHGVDPRVSGPAYQSRFVQFVELLLSRGFVVVLDLHWTNSTGGLARGQDLFLSSSSPKFWASVASHPALRSRPGVVFELFNEPHDAPGGTAKLTPECFLNGQGCPHAAVAAGDGSNGCTAALQQLCGSARRASIGSCWVCEDAHQSTLKPAGCSDADLVDFCTGGSGSTGGFSGYNQAVQAFVRDSGANNLVLFAGKQWNFDLEWLLAHFPTDPLQNCAAAWHPYEFKCKDFECKESVADPLTEQFPLFVTEWAPGWPQSNRSPPSPDAYSQRVLDWADSMPSTVALFPWVWNPGGGKERVNSARSDYSGNHPTSWGKQYREWVPKTPPSY